MEKSAAHRLVRETLQSAFHEEQFSKLVVNLLNYPESAPFTYNGNYIYDDFADSIRQVKRLGKYTDPRNRKLDILIVYLKKEAALDHARAKQRNFIAKYLNGGRGNVLKDAALVAFVAPNGEDWRFSLVKMEYKFDEQGKVKEELTPARRYSFLVGKNEDSHTAQSGLLPLLLNDSTKPTLKDLEDAFSVERVTREFFGKYRGLFLWLKESLDVVVAGDDKIQADFEAKNVDNGDFAKKLLGQIVFLYFLQKKGWFGVARGAEWGSGSKHFLRELFEKKHGDYENFFNDILEPLFYNTLATERSKDWSDRFDCRIPFLNGGLFDPLNNYDWVDTDILLPNDLFSNRRKTEEGDTGDGILDIFDRYNFTVKEDEPLEKEVAVDPEMLGKVFENLLAVQDRKATGTYYTPREIVHYMCQESLTNYLTTELNGNVSKEDIEKLVQYGEAAVENDRRVVNKGRETKTYTYKLPESIREHARAIDDKLASIRVCDPAVGSGAFPVGMMNEIVRTRGALTPYIVEDGKRDPYRFKRQAIQHCLYGVDIDPGAVEIAKLRLWLSLVVDEEEREAIQPLPNLNYRIVRGNALFRVEKTLFNHGLFDKLENIKSLYFDETRPSKKQEYRNQIDALIGQITNGRKEFDFEVYFSEVFHEKKGFDVVIANPPYVQLQKMRNTPEHDAYQQQKYKAYASTGDIYCLFYERGIQIARKNGVLCYISSNKWMRTGYGKNVRSVFVEYNPLLLIDLGPNVFETATVDTNILLLQNASNQHCLRALTITQRDGSDIADKVEQEAVTLSHLDSGPWFIGSEAEITIKAKIERLGTPLKQWDINIYYGIKTGCNEAFIIDNEKRQEILNRCRTDGERQRTKALIKPILRGRDIKRYAHQWAGLWLIATGYDLDITKRYPAVYQYLKIIGEQIESRLSKVKGKGLFNRDDQGVHWWNLRPCDYYPEFEKEKIVYPVINTNAQFYTTSDCLFLNDKAFMITGKNLKYLTGVLNSNMIHPYLQTIGSPLGEKGVEYRKIYMDQLPIPKITAQNQPLVTQVEAQVSDILAAKKASPNADTSTLEAKIDQLVYQLYDLTDEEIAIVERASARSSSAETTETVP